MNIGIDFEKLNQGVRPQVMTHFTKVPNFVIDEIMGQISDKAFKCLSLIIRQTIGYDRASHTIAITQFQKHCNIKKRDTVMSAIKELEQCKLIKVERQTGVLNNYFITLNQYQQTGLVPNLGSTVKGDGTSTVKGDGTSTVERGTNKETLKENIKDSSSSRENPKFPKFEVQKGTHFIHYFDEDFKSYTLENLCSVYDVQNNFFAQAQSSHPDCTSEKLESIWSGLAAWSVKTDSHKSQKRPVEWMQTWLQSVDNNKHKAAKEQTKTTYQKPKSSWAEYFANNGQVEPQMRDVDGSVVG